MIRTRQSFGRIALLFLAVAVASGCALLGRTGGIPRQPFADIPVPDTFLTLAGEWAMIQSGPVTAARLVYQTELPLEDAVKAIDTLLKANGWTPDGVEPIERAGFKGRALAFTKGPDTCRAEVVPSSTTTRVDLIVGRLSP